MSCYAYESGAVRESLNQTYPALCNDKSKFVKTRRGSVFSLQRPAFKSGVSSIREAPIPALKPNERRGLGNYHIQRNNFLQPPIKGRQAINTEKLQVFGVGEDTPTIELGDKTIEKLLTIQVDDPTDVKWIEQRNELMNERGITKEKATRLMARPQRKIRKQVRFGARHIDINDEVEGLKAAVTQGLLNNSKDATVIMKSLQLLLSETGTISRLTEAGMDNLKDVLKRIPVPVTHKTAGLETRLISRDQYRKNAGKINLFILNKAEKAGRLDNPLSIVDKDAVITGYTNPSSNLNSLLGSRPAGIQEFGRFIDLKEMAIIPFNIATTLSNNGVDNGQLDGKNPVDGLWVPDKPLSEQVSDVVFESKEDIIEV